MHSWQSQLLRIQKLIQTNELVRAENELLALNQEHANQPELLFELARLYFLNRDHRQARATLALGLKNAPRHPQGLLLKGMDALQQGKFRAAQKALLKSIKQNPTFHLPHYYLGIALARIGEPANAIEILERATNLDRNHGLSFFELGTQYVVAGETEKAERALTRSIRLNPNHAQSYLILSQLLLRLNRLNEASELLTRALRHNADDLLLIEAHIDLLLILGRAESALNLCRQLVTSKPNYQTWLKLGLVAVAIGKSQDAVAAFSQAIDIEPDRWEAHYNLGEIFFAQGLYQLSRRHFEQAIALTAKDYKPYNGLGLLMLHLGQTGKETEILLQKAQTLAPDRPEPLLNLALLFAKQGRKKKANALISKLLEKQDVTPGLRGEAERLLAQLHKRE